jgi:hypothetical protein
MILLLRKTVLKSLQSSGFRISTFISDIFGASGINILNHLIHNGQIDRIALDTCLKTKTRNWIEEILIAVNGTLSEHQRSFLKLRTKMGSKKPQFSFCLNAVLIFEIAYYFVNISLDKLPNAISCTIIL